MANEYPRPPGALVIGIGNAYRSDDAAGLIAARRIKERVSGHCSVIENAGEGTSLMELWKNAGRVVVIDAARSGAAPGTVRRFDAALHPLPASVFRGSTHAFSLPEAIELSRALQQLPRQLIVYGVEAHNFEAGSNLSPALESAMPQLVECVLQELLDTNASRGQKVPVVRS